MTTLRSAVLSSLYGVAGITAVMLIPTAVAQTTAPEKKADTVAVEAVNIVGTRRANASATDTVVPVDFIPLSKAAEQGGQFDLAQTLQYISPSFNSTRQTGADGADLVDSAALRGLGSDQTLVLVNGKRKHTSALVNLFGARIAAIPALISTPFRCSRLTTCRCCATVPLRSMVRTPLPG